MRDRMFLNPPLEQSARWARRGEKAAYLHLMLQICQWFVVQNERVMATRISIKLLGIEERVIRKTREWADIDLITSRRNASRVFFWSIVGSWCRSAGPA